ncbi:MAG: hypothetical protein WCE90_06730 [Candidatus Zixiibacteriota bacterium]
MKPLRIFVMVALLVLPLLASTALADFTADTVFTQFYRVSATTTNQPIIGFTIPGGAHDTLKSLAVKSYMERAFSVKQLKLWVETNHTKGWQSTDTHIKSFDLTGMRFETQDTIVISGINRLIRASNVDTFYITVDAYTDSVNAQARYYDTHGLDLVLEPGYIHLGLTSGETNTNRVNNNGYHPAVGQQPPYFDPFKLVFDTQGPPITMYWCFGYDGCKTGMIDLGDSICIMADTTAFTGPGDAIKGDITVDLRAFGFAQNFPLKAGTNGRGCFRPDKGGPIAGWDSCFTIPDTHIPGCIDVDTGYVIYAIASDSAGNKDTAELYFNKKIDTCKPKIDSVQFYICYDKNGDGIAAIGDSLAIYAWGTSNPSFEVDSMIADLRTYFPSTPGMQWVKLEDISNNNWIFRKKVLLTEQPVQMMPDSSDNRLTIWAWDNACNYDTLQKMLNKRVDLQKPAFTSCSYYYRYDSDTIACIGIGDSVEIGADLNGTNDLAAVTVDLVEGGINGPANQPLYDDGAATHGDHTAGDKVYNLLWKVGEPPIEDGKDTNNTAPPAIDYDYTVLITAYDSAGNYATCRTPRLNRILDTRRPRWTNQDKLYIKPVAGARVEIRWPTSQTTPANSCNEKDAMFFYVYVDSGSGYGATPIGATFNGEYKADTNMWRSEILSDGKYYKFKIKQQDDCSNLSDFSKEMSAVADGTPPHVCIALPDSGMTFGSPFEMKAVADSTSHDVASAELWYRFRRDLSGPIPPGPWTYCGTMDYPGQGYVFTDLANCIHGYLGWVEIMTKACDQVGNCQDTIMAYNDACIVNGDVFRPGHFIIYWDTLAPQVQVVSVDGFASPQTACGYNVSADSLNRVIFTVTGAAATDSFTIDVRAIYDITSKRIDYRANVTMPCTLMVDAYHWAQGTKNLYIHVTDQANGKKGDLVVPFCVPAWQTPCVKIVDPMEWERIPCSNPDHHLGVYIRAELDTTCAEVPVSEVVFQWSPTGSDPWYLIDDVVSNPVTSSGAKANVTVTPLQSSWHTYWINSGLHDGDTVFLRVIGYTQYYKADTSYMVKVFVDCKAPRLQLQIDDIVKTGCNGTSKVAGDIDLKAALLDTTVDVDEVTFWYLDATTNPDINYYWHYIGEGYPSNGMVYVYHGFNTTGLHLENHLVYFRAIAKDISGNMMFDMDGDHKFDDHTFNAAEIEGSGLQVIVDNEAPQPAISDVGDPASGIHVVNPSEWLDGTGAAGARAGDTITAQISVLPSEDTCEVMKVEWFLCWDTTSQPAQISRAKGSPKFDNADVCVHVGTSTNPYHYPVTFNPLTQGLIPAYMLEDGYWEGYLKAVLYDSLGNSKADEIEFYILDVTPTQAVIVKPLNDSYVSGEVKLDVKALNAYEIAKVCYEYRVYASEGDTTWLPINGGYPNACVNPGCERGLKGAPAPAPDFSLTWYTLNTVPDGVYQLRAVATDCDGNVDQNPHTIKVTVNNLPPSVDVSIPDSYTCKRTCPDNPEDTLVYVSGTVPLYAVATSEIPVDHVVFMYKNVFTYPDTWTPIDSDYFPTDGKYSVNWYTWQITDGRYEVKSVAYDKSGKYGESKPKVVSLDNTGPFAKVISINGEDHLEYGVDISRGAVIPIEIVAIDSSSSDGWTRCYNSGLTSISVCIEDCIPDTCDTFWRGGEHGTIVDSIVSRHPEYTKCFEVSPVSDGFHTIQWNTSGLEFTGCHGCYQIYVKAYDCLGNVRYSEKETVYVSDITAPITTIGGFDGNYIYGYAGEKLRTLLFEYADSGSTNWTPIGYSSALTMGCYSSPGCECGYYLYKTSWDPASLTDGHYQIRVISHDTCSNQNDSLAPVAYFTVASGTITPYAGPLEGLSFMKNWCVGGMHGVVHEKSTVGTPVIIARYGSSYIYECVEMQDSLSNSSEYDGSFFADPITNGGPAEFFSSVTVKVSQMPPASTGEPAKITYLNQGSFDVVQVKRDVGTHGTYQNGCVQVTIPQGAVGSTFQYDRYIWVSPTWLEWSSLSQPDLQPIGDNNGMATYISFTDCYYCCGWYGSHYGGEQGKMLKSPSDVSSDCCFNPGETNYAKIKMCYDHNVTTDSAHLEVMWWDCEDGEFKSDGIFYPNGVEGFNTTNHTVEFATTCLSGPFVVVRLKERPCQGTIVVNMLDVEPYCKGYTNATPQFKANITDNVEGTDGIDRHSIQFKADLFNPGELIPIYDGSHDDVCHKWARGFGSFEGSGYDKVSGIFRAGWNDSTYLHSAGDNDKWNECDQCYRTYDGSAYRTYCKPMYPLAEGDHIAVVTAMNDHIQTCTDTAHIKVDATKPWMVFADSIGAYVSKNPHFCMYFNDAKSGIDKHSIWMDVFGASSSNYTTDPSQHYYDATIAPDQLHWVNDTTVCVDLTYEFSQGGYLHVFVYGGPAWKCGASCPNYNYYGYNGGIADCVGNRLDPFWRYFVIDAYGPTITSAYNTLCDPELKFQITDAMSGVGNVYVYEDSTLKSLIQQDPHNPSYWYYTPSAGPHHVDIRAFDKLGNLTVKSFDLAGDCNGPVVSFVPGYVSCKNPTVKIVVSDAGSGVMWDSLMVDLWLNWYYYIQTFGPSGPNAWTRVGDTITVVGNGAQLNLSDGSNLWVTVYSEKSSSTTYTKGPKDLAGNSTDLKWVLKNYKADCVGPSIAWTNSGTPCQRPIKLRVTDATSGVATVMLYEDKVDKTSSLVWNASSGLYEYTPSAGNKHTLDVIATDLVGNDTTYTFDAKSDCQGPAVAFDNGYVNNNPTIMFWVTDPSGVDWTTVNARVSGCGKECYYQAPELVKHANLTTGLVTLEDCILDCSDGYAVDVYVYSGTNSTGTGPADVIGNYDAAYSKCSFEVDAIGPVISVPSTTVRPIEICVTDAKSGVDWSTLEFYENDSLACKGSNCVEAVKLDTTNGCIEYSPPAGRVLVKIMVKDRAGNPAPIGVKGVDAKFNAFYTEDEALSFSQPHNYPNPFDPRDGRTTIDLGLSRSAYVSVKIYDFGGEFVRDLQEDKLTQISTPLYWDGKTDAGTEVANGTYLCYIHARDDSGSTKTAVIKITVLKKDK